MLKALSAPLGSYEAIDERKLGQATAVAWASRQLEDADWDRFLQETLLGQFQQSAMWSQAKASEGWSPVRVRLTVDQELAGGFQLLWRRSRLGHMGYVSKGPVVAPGYPGLAEFAGDLLLRLAAREKLRGLIVQPPDLCQQMAPTFAMRGFDYNTLVGVIEATCIVDLADGFAGVERRMSKWTRKKIRQAVHRGIHIREGRREDVRTFFELMLSTCRRQGTRPVPSDVRTLLALWDAAEPEQSLRMTFAEYDGQPVAGLVCILFGKTVTFWKKGWTSSHGELHPNELLMQEMLKWSSARGYRFADFCALDKEMAITMLEGRSLSARQESSRHMFNVRLGARPRLLPEARVYFPNSWIRLGYRAVYRKKLRQKNEAANFRSSFGMHPFDAAGVNA